MQISIPKAVNQVNKDKFMEMHCHIAGKDKTFKLGKPNANAQFLLLVWTFYVQIHQQLVSRDWRNGWESTEVCIL